MHMPNNIHHAVHLILYTVIYTWENTSYSSFELIYCYALKNTSYSSLKSLIWGLEQQQEVWQQIVSGTFTKLWASHHSESNGKLLNVQLLRKSWSTKAEVDLATNMCIIKDQVFVSKHFLSPKIVWSLMIGLSEICLFFVFF